MTAARDIGFWRRMPGRVLLKAAGILARVPVLGRLVRRGRLVSVPFEKVRCQQMPFSDRLGFAGRPIDEFPPCRFYRMSLSDPEAARNGLQGWLLECFVGMEGWKVPKSEGGLANGSMVRLVRSLHRERGIEVDDPAQAEPALVEEAARLRAAYYLELLYSIQENGYRSNCIPPIRCQARDGLYYLVNGHHRAAALRVLGHEDLPVRIE
jgi:hypothetical protein